MDNPNKENFKSFMQIVEIYIKIMRWEDLDILNTQAKTHITKVAYINKIVT